MTGPIKTAATGGDEPRSNPPKYIIVAVAFYGKKRTHEELMAQVNEHIGHGYEPLGPPFMGVEMMYQALIKRSDSK
jgi:hypothetical protein